LEFVIPFSASRPPRDLTKKIKKRHPKATKNEIKQFIHVFNNSIAEGGSNARAYAKAWGVLNQNKKLKSSHQETDQKETIKKIKKWEKKNNKVKKKKTSSYDLEQANILLSLANELDELGPFKRSDYLELIVVELV